MEIKNLMYARALERYAYRFFSIAPIVIYALTFSGTNVYLFLPINIAVYIHWRFPECGYMVLGFLFPELTSSQQYV